MLDYNSLESLDPWPYIRGLHGTPLLFLEVEISVKSNYIYKFTNNIGWHVNCSQRSYANLDISDNYVMHLTDLASGWNISSFEWLCLIYPEYDFLLKRYVYSFEIILASSHLYYCDCLDLFFLMTAKRLLNGVRCSWPLSLANQTATNVSLYEFLCDESEQSNCPPGCQCVYRTANSTFHIYCSAANVSSLPLELPPIIEGYNYKLDFSNNKHLERLEHRPYFANASFLDVSNCSISSVDLKAWQELSVMASKHYYLNPFYSPYSPDPNYYNMYITVVVTPFVLLHGNRIESLSVDVIDINLTSIYLTLNDNPWKCSCDNRWTIPWFKSLSSVKSSKISDVLCASPSRLKGRSILHADEVEFCVDPLRRMLKIVLSVHCLLWLH